MFTHHRFQTDPNGSGPICLLFTRVRSGTSPEPTQNGTCLTRPAILQVQFWIRSGPCIERSCVNTCIGCFPHRVVTLSLETSEISWREIQIFFPGLVGYLQKIAQDCLHTCFSLYPSPLEALST